MFLLYTFLSLILIALIGRVSGNPVGSSVAKTTRSSLTKIDRHGGLSRVKKDHTHVHAMIRDGQLEKRSRHTIYAKDTIMGPAVEVGVGTRPINYRLLVDTRSSLTVVGTGNESYQRTVSSNYTGYSFADKYRAGEIDGTLWKDTVTLSNNLVIHQQPIGAATNYSGNFAGYDGILGVGPVDLTEHTVAGVGEVSTVMAGLFHQGEIPGEVLGITWVPPLVPNNRVELTFGEVDESATTSHVVYAPLAKEDPYKYYWSTNQSISYGTKPLSTSESGVIDSGTAFTFLPSSAFEEYIHMTGAIVDPTTKIPKITQEQYENLKSLVFFIGGEVFEMTRNAQIWPRSVNYVIGCGTKDICLAINNIKFSETNDGFDGIINGLPFLRRFYTVLDATNKRVGLANTTHTHSESN